MNYALLWIDAWIVSLLWMAFFAACIGRLQRKWVWGVLLSIVFLIPLSALGSFVVAAASMKFRGGFENNWFVYFVCLLLAYLVGTILILYQGRRREPGTRAAAVNWRRAPLALAFLITAGVGYMTLLNMDLAIRARCAILSVRATAIYLAGAPAITTESQNAASLYEKIFARLRKNPGTDVYNPPFGDNRVFNPNEPATITFLAQQADTIRMIRQAAARPACRFDSDLVYPNFATILPDLNQVRNAANLLRLHAREELAHGHVASAVEDVASVLKMSRQFAQRPLLVSALVGIGIDAAGDKTLEKVLPAVARQDELSSLHLEEFPSLGQMLQQSLRAEEAFGLMLYGNMPASDLTISKDDVNEETNLVASTTNLGSIFLRVFFLDLDEYIRLQDDMQLAATQPYYKVQNRLKDLHNRPMGLFTSILAPSLAQTLITNARAEAADACAQVAVALTRYRLDNGKMPSRLVDLVPTYLDAIPSDPFDGHPIRLVIKHNNWIIYSVGPNRIDDDGIERTTRDNGDLTFTLHTVSTIPATKPSGLSRKG